jgi:pilus assembly protein CpaE
LIGSQELGALDVRIVVNRFEKGLFRAIKPADVRQALGRDVAYTIANDHAVVSAAVEQGVPISAIKRRSNVGKDIELLEAGIAAALKLER